ncbi:MAG: hypothetical protein IPG71_05820 [bacterium]|nr:hypothetical protein [bacterium]
MIRHWSLALLLFAASVQAADFKTPVLLTSGGQSADPQMIKTLLTRENIPFTYEPLATSAMLAGQGALIIVLGGSSKGLGAAKVSAEQETARITELLKSAAEQKITVLAVHVGGKNRRGALSDEFNKLGANMADEIVVVVGGDDDGLFKGIAESRKVPYSSAAKIADLGGILRAKFAPAQPTQE